MSAAESEAPEPVSAERASTPFLNYLASVRPEVDAELDRLLPRSTEVPRRLHEAMRYSVFAGGKRVRPALMLLSGESLGAERSRLLAAAAALEMLHTFSLVHDDLPALDDDDLRRGRATAHRRYDEATAILVGDALLNLGLAVVARHPESAPPETRLRAVSLLSEAIGTAGMIGGQVADLEAENHWPDDAVGALESIHRRKTGALLTASVRLGGLLAGADATADGRLARLGERLGLLFQIGDDILDVECSTEELGKTAGKDAEARKLTYPALFGLEESKKRLAEVGDEALEIAAGLAGDRGLFASLIAYLRIRDH